MGSCETAWHLLEALLYTTLMTLVLLYAGPTVSNEEFGASLASHASSTMVGDPQHATGVL